LANNSHLASRDVVESKLPEETVKRADGILERRISAMMVAALPERASLDEFLYLPGLR